MIQPDSTYPKKLFSHFLHVFPFHLSSCELHPPPLPTCSFHVCWELFPHPSGLGGHHHHLLFSHGKNMWNVQTSPCISSLFSHPILLLCFPLNFHSWIGCSMSLICNILYTWYANYPSQSSFSLPKDWEWMWEKRGHCGRWYFSRSLFSITSQKGWVVPLSPDLMRNVHSVGWSDWLLGGGSLMFMWVYVANVKNSTHTQIFNVCTFQVCGVVKYHHHTYISFHFPWPSNSLLNQLWMFVSLPLTDT